MLPTIKTLNETGVSEWLPESGKTMLTTIKTQIETLWTFDLINTLCGAALILLALLLVRVYWQEWWEKHSPAAREREKVLILLQDICPVWVKSKDGKLVRLEKKVKGRPQIMVENLASRWREPKVVEPEEEKPGKVRLRNKRAARLYKSLSKTNKKHLNVIARLLMLLDKDSGCSSIVSPQATQDQETSWDTKTCRELGGITLLDHTLNVTELVIAKLKEENANHMMPDAVVAALGHDIGKLSSEKEKLYAHGHHYLTSAEVISAIPGFSKLPKKDAILKLIKTHHEDSDDFLAIILRQADEQARREEVKQENTQVVVAQVAAEAQPAAGQPEEDADQWDEEETETPADLQTSTQPALKTQDATDGDIKEKKWGARPKEQVPELDISQWFNADLCLQEIKRHINVLNENKFQAFSMPNGIVYVKSELLGEIALEQANKAKVLDITMRNKTKKSEMKPVYIAMVNIFRGRSAIETSLIGEGLYGRLFVVLSRDGGKQKGYYSPFTAEVFLSLGESIDELEQRKKGRLMDFTSVDILQAA